MYARHSEPPEERIYTYNGRMGRGDSYRYDAFGNLLEREETVPNRILYTGQQYDQETGQYYLRARYYNPVVGRFLQEDAYHGDGLNLYAYCGNNPVVYYDPSGHDSAAVMKKAEEPELPVGVGKNTVNYAVYEDADKWLSLLTEDEKEAIRIYTGNDYKSINQYLRGQTEQLPSHLNQGIIENIDSALGKVETKYPCTVYRGTNIYDDIEKYFEYSDNTLKSVDGLIGATIYEKGFLSTSIDMDASFEYLEIHWTIEVPPGSNGALISQISKIPEEMEMLFSTGQNLLIKDAAINGNNIEILAEIVNER